MPHPEADLTADIPVTSAPPTEPSSIWILPSARAFAARRILGGGITLGLAADPLLRGGDWGLGLLVWMLLFALVAIALIRGNDRALSREGACWLAVAVLAAAGLSWRDSAMLQVLDVLAMLTALTLLAMTLDATPVRSLALARVRDLFISAFDTGLNVMIGVFPLLLHDVEYHASVRPGNRGRTRRIGKALLVTVPIVLLFTALLAQADPIFGSFFSFPALDLDVIFSHVVVAGVFGWVAAGWFRRALLHKPELTNPSAPFPMVLGSTDVMLVLGALNVLFAAFVLVQIGWLFGGEALVLKTTGLTYAAYARHGFFELTWVAGLLLILLLGAKALIPVSNVPALRAFRRLAVPLVLLLAAIIVSAAARMRLYVLYYGLSTDRLFAITFMVWLTLVFGWLLVTVLRSRPRSFAMGLVVSGFAVLLALNCLNPDTLVTHTNLARSRVGRAGAADPDYRYLATLGGDAVPALVAELTTPTVAVDSAGLVSRCAAAKILVNRWAGSTGQAMAQDWTRWNSGRARALATMRTRWPELIMPSCAKRPA